MKTDRFGLSPLGEALMWIAQNKRDDVKNIWNSVEDVEARENKIKLLLKQHPDDLSLDLSDHELSQLTHDIEFVTHS
tara:strand:+ start:508 stop:738 length:231 start_codon:yes stop_codon:yes gene_type:complete